MTTKILSLISLFLVLSSCATPSTSTTAFQAPPFHLRAFESETLKNGLKILWIPDNSLPYVSLSMMVKSGSADDPTGSAGLASFTASLLNRGTDKRNAMQISADLDQIGGSFSASADQDMTFVNASSLSFHRDEILKQFGEIFLRPAFSKEEINRHRRNLLAGMKVLADQPSDFAYSVLPHFLYGNHPYGHTPNGTPKSVAKIERAGVLRFYRRHYVPTNAVLAVVGQYDTQWKSEVERMFGAWYGPHVAAHNRIPSFPEWKGIQSLVVDRDDLKQAQVLLTFKGVPRNTPEYLSLRAALKILGDSFGSRLFDEIRVKRGLTYDIESWFDPREGVGPMGIYTFTRVDKIPETVTETLKTYRQFVTGGVTDAEVEEAKALMQGQFPRIFETAESLGTQLLILERYGISSDYLTGYLDHLGRINKQTVNDAIHKYFDPNNIKILVYAPKAKAAPVLKSLGPVQVENYRRFL